MLEVGQLSYVSGLPIAYAFQHGLLGDDAPASVYGHPDDLDAAMRRGELAAGAISAIEYVRHQDRYELIPDLSIGSWGRIGSSVLFGRESFGKLTGQTIALSRHGTTSNALTRFLVGKLYGVEANFVEAEGTLKELLERYPAVLLIGDQAVVESRNAEVSTRLDLGEAWWQAMHTPFVHTLWACQADLPAADRERLAGLFQRAKQLSQEHHAQIVAQASVKLNVPAAEIEAYYALLNFDLTPVHRQSLKLFGEYLQETSLQA